MRDQPSNEAVTSFVREYFQDSSTELKPDTCLVSTYGVNDPDLFTDFLEVFSNRFGVRQPRITNLQAYFASEWRRRGFRLLDISRLFTRTLSLEIRTLTLQELWGIAESGVWPSDKGK